MTASHILCNWTEEAPKTFRVQVLGDYLVWRNQLVCKKRGLQKMWFAKRHGLQKPVVCKKKHGLQKKTWFTNKTWFAKNVAYLLRILATRSRAGFLPPRPQPHSGHSWMWELFWSLKPKITLMSEVSMQKLCTQAFHYLHAWVIHEANKTMMTIIKLVKLTMITMIKTKHLDQLSAPWT